MCVFQAEFDEDRALRLVREEVIVKQLTDHEHEVNERFEKQIVSFHFLIVLTVMDYSIRKLVKRDIQQ